MKCVLILSLFIMSFCAYAERKSVGVSLGNPTGLNGKYWLDDKSAIDGGLGISFGKHTDPSIHSDYLLHSPSAFYFNDDHALDLYYGIGGRMEFADDIELGVRVPVGIVHELENKTSDIFAEVAPILNITGGQGVELHLLFGSRYYF